jgi:hypothetical protein
MHETYYRLTPVNDAVLIVLHKYLVISNTRFTKPPNGIVDYLCDKLSLICFCLYGLYYSSVTVYK